LERPHELRELANWFRGWADVGTEGDRAWRDGFVVYLEKVALEIEVVQMRATRRKHPVEGRLH
jgi:hypothetical protein